MWQSVRIEPIASGCPNRCRHCAEDAGPPYGELDSELLYPGAESIHMKLADRYWQEG